MLSLPSPLHPAVVHFPIVLILLGAAVAAAWCVFETGHYGGQLVYRHGAGVNLARAGDTGSPTTRTPAEAPRQVLLPRIRAR